MKIKNYLTLILLINSMSVFAQTEPMVRSGNKLFVVIGVITIIFILIVLYLIRLDLKITKLEKQQE